MHKTVLLNEAIDNLNVKEDGIYVDATLGFGGHSGLILKRVKRGFLFAFDQDEMAIEYSDKKLSEIGNNYEIIKSNFVNLKEELNKRGICTKIRLWLFPKLLQRHSVLRNLSSTMLIYIVGGMPGVSPRVTKPLCGATSKLL